MAIHLERTRDGPRRRRLDAGAEGRRVRGAAAAAVPAKREVERDISQVRGLTGDDHGLALPVRDHESMDTPVGAAVGVTAVTAGENVGGVLLPEGGGTPEEARAELDVVVGGDLRGRRAGHRGLCSRHGAEGHEAQGHPQQHRDRLWYAS